MATDNKIKSEGMKAAEKGVFRVPPKAYRKWKSPEWAEWEAGYDEVTKDGGNPCLTPSFNLRAGVTRCNSAET